MMPKPLTRISLGSNANLQKIAWLTFNDYTIVEKNGHFYAERPVSLWTRIKCWFK